MFRVGVVPQNRHEGSKHKVGADEVRGRGAIVRVAAVIGIQKEGEHSPNRSHEKNGGDEVETRIVFE